MSNFILNCINGDALLSEIDDYVELWHDSDTELSLHEFLGMTKKEYALYVEDEQYLAMIVTARREKSNIELIIESQVAMAARSDNQAKSARLQRWLKNEGLWD
jgi:hypothetical protein